MGIKLAASTLVERDGTFLLVQEGRDPKRRFSQPGGGLRKRETVAGAAVRETREETGLEVELDYIIGDYQIPRTQARNNLLRYVYKAIEVGGDIQTSEDHPVVDFFSYKEIKKMHEAGQLSGLSVLAALKDYLNNKGRLLSTSTVLPSVKKKLLLPKHLIDQTDEDLGS